MTRAAAQRGRNVRIRVLANGRVTATPTGTREPTEPKWRESTLAVLEELGADATAGELARYLGASYSTAWHRLATLRAERQW